MARLLDSDESALLLQEPDLKAFFTSLGKLVKESYEYKNYFSPGLLITDYRLQIGSFGLQYYSHDYHHSSHSGSYFRFCILLDKSITEKRFFRKVQRIVKENLLEIEYSKEYGEEHACNTIRIYYLDTNKSFLLKEFFNLLTSMLEEAKENKVEKAKVQEEADTQARQALELDVQITKDLLQI